MSLCYFFTHYMSYSRYTNSTLFLCVQSNANPVCFGFISFETVASVQSVLQVNYKYQFLVSRLKVFEFLIFKLSFQAAKNTPFMLADRKLRVKEKEGKLLFP